jgi:mRNA interferase MazF
MPGETFDPFEVVVVPFPFTDISRLKRRPALVVSTRLFNDRHGQPILAMITSAKGSDWMSDTPLRGWREAGLTAACRVRLKLFTLDKALIVRRLGNLGAEDRRSVRAALSGNLALS